MNQQIETAIISNLKTAFPTARIFTGKVVQGITPTDIIVNTVYDNVNIFKGSIYRQRELTYSVTRVSPVDGDYDLLVNALKKLTVNSFDYFPDSINADYTDDTLQVLVEMKHLEI